MLAVHESMARINSCPVPYPFLCILHLSTFLFVFRYVGGWMMTCGSIDGWMDR